MQRTLRYSWLRGGRCSSWLAGVGLGICLMLAGFAAGAQSAPGTATLSGRVQADKPFKAAKVRATNIDRNVMYMVYTANGNYKAVGLLPGRYEVTVQKNGFASELRTVDVKAGAAIKVDFQMKSGGPTEFLSFAQVVRNFRGWSTVTEYRLYDEAFPPGPDRELIKDSCMGCHSNPSYMPAHPLRADEWLSAIKLHLNPSGHILEALTPSEQKLMKGYIDDPVLMDRMVKYLAINFPAGVRKGVRFDPNDVPMDESVLANAMYVEYFLPKDPKLDAGKLRRQAQDPHVDLKGNVWYTDNNEPARVGVLDPRTAQFKDYLLASPDAYPHGIAVDANNEVWWAERDVNYIGRLDQKTGKVTRYVADTTGSFKPGSGGHGDWWAHTPIIDSKQNVWYSHIGTDKIGKWDRETGRISSVMWGFETQDGVTRDYSLEGGRAYGMDVDRDDNIWVAGTGSCSVAKFDQKTQRFTVYASLRQPKPCDIYRVGVDLQGNAWYGTRNGYLGRVDAKTGKVTEWPSPLKYSNPYDVQADMNGNIWFSDGGMGGAIIRFDPATAKFDIYPTPQITDVPRMNISAAGALWYCARSADRAAVGVLYPDITKFKEIPVSADIPMTLMRYKQPAVSRSD